MMDVETILRYTELTWKELDVLIETSIKNEKNHTEKIRTENNGYNINHNIKKWLKLITSKF